MIHFLSPSNKARIYLVFPGEEYDIPDSHILLEEGRIIYSIHVPSEMRMFFNDKSPYSWMTGYVPVGITRMAIPSFHEAERMLCD